ncbi:MAG: disulfide bond formation protein B [Chlamydiales bacterium]|nr:disulfide bond formation protein B [Chlamydiales bacterium]
MKRALWIFLGIAVASLAISFFVEYVLGIRPCILCQLQRIPYFTVGGLAILGLFVRWKQGVIRVIQVCFLAGVILASYHTCVQFGFLGSPCQKKRTEQTGPSWRILGLPPPLYNGVFSLAVLIGTEVFLVRWRNRQ